MKHLTSIFALVLACIVIITGCDLFTETPPTTGSITGKVTFSNSSSHTGIVVSLESRTADITRSVSRALSGETLSPASRALEGQTTTNAEGSYRFTGIPEGDYTLYASSKDSSEQAVYTSITVESGRTLTAPDLQLTAVGSIRGRILLDGSANGNMGFIVFIADTSYMAITGDEGNFTISRVPSGSAYDLIIMRGTDTYYWDNVTVNAGGVTQLGTKTLLSEDFPGIISVTWKGALADAPESPGLYWTYYNTTDGNSYIYNGSGWDLLAAAGADGADGATGATGPAGADGISIIWKGELSVAPSDPEVNWAYYNTTDGISYIYDGSQWNILAQDGADGEDGADGADGSDGLSIEWLGEYSSAPSGASVNNAYYNTADGNSYIYNGSGWDLLAAAGTDGADGATGAAGADGISIVWKGELSVAPSDPEVNWAYYDSSEGKSYIYDGSSWNILAQDGSDGADGADGSDGISIVWLGEYSSAPSGVSVNNAYYNTSDGNSYIYNGSGWDLLAAAGADGADGATGATGAAGADGISIVWKGELSVAPSDPEVNWAYYDSSEGKSYIYDGSSWNILAQDGSDGADGADGSDGISIVWLGEYSSAPSGVSVNNAYYNTSDGNSYIYNGSGWDLLAAAGADGADGATGATGAAGADGISIIWRGELGAAPSSPELNWAYYNTTDGISYIYDGSSWNILAQDGDHVVWITYESNGAESGVAPAVAFVYSGDELTVNDNTGALSCNGYVFSGWNTQPDGTGVGYAAGAVITLEANLTVYAQWDILNYTLTYYLNDGFNHIDNPDTFTIEDDTITLLEPSKEGYSFIGWFTDSEFTTSINEIPSGSYGDKSFYVDWEANEYTVTFDHQGGEGGSTSVIATFDSEMPVAIAPTKTGYIFRGYYDQQEGSGTQFYNQTMSSASKWNRAANTTLYAKWEESIPIKSVTAGGYFTLIQKENGTLWATGNNRHGELGLGDITQRRVPEQVEIQDIKAISAGNDHTLVLKEDGTLYGTGTASLGVLGIDVWDYTDTLKLIPFQDPVDIIAGGWASFVLQEGGTLWATGTNSYGELGLGDTIQRDVLEQVDMQGVLTVSTEFNQTLILKEDGTLWATGKNNYGQLGLGDTTDRLVPEQVDIQGVKAVATGWGHSMIIKEDGSLWAMGRNLEGQLGLGDTTKRLIPVQVDITDVQAVGACGDFTMILKNDGTLWATGRNNYGQLGLGDTTNRLIPVQVDIQGVQAIAVGKYHTMILKTDGTLWATGGNGSGALGLGDITQCLVPEQVY